MPSIEPHENRWSGGKKFQRSIIQLFIVFVLYILSTGPMYWYCFSAYYLSGSEFVAKLYLPLVWACEIDVINNFFDWYIGLWIF